MRSGFFNNTTVWAEDFAKFAHGILTNGVLADTTGALLVTTAASNMKINVAPGYAWIEGHFMLNEDTASLTLDTADGTYTRIDRVVSRLNFTNNEITLQVIKGTPAASPSAPDIVRDGTIYDLGLAIVTIPAGTLEITAAMITDTRANAAVCGGVYPRMSDAFIYPGANFIGDIKMTACATAPTGWLICDGSAVSRTRYADLFANIGTAYGAGDGSTTFNLPDLRGRTPFGKDSGTFNALGNKGGAETHILTTAELANHTHSVSVTVTKGGSSMEYTTGSGDYVQITHEKAGSDPTVTMDTNVTVGTAGSNSPVSLLPPYNTVNFIIYTGVTT